MDEARRAGERAAARGDGAAWWVAALRSGAIGRADLELAAYMGDQGARVALGPSALVLPAPTVDTRDEHRRRARERSLLADRLRGLERWGAPVFVRALVAPVDGQLASTGPAPDLAGRLRSALTTWCDRPTREGAHEVHARWKHLADTVGHHYDPGGDVCNAMGLVSVAAGLARPSPGAGGNDPRRRLTAYLRDRSPREAEPVLRPHLVALARSGASLAWSRDHVPRPCPAPDPTSQTVEAITRLAPERVELAAWLGDPTARAVLGASVFSRWPGANGWEEGRLTRAQLVASDVGAWLRELGSFGVEPRILALGALGRLAAELAPFQPHQAAKARLLLDAASARPVERRGLRRLLADTGLARSLVATRAGPHARLVEQVAELATGVGPSWKPARWEVEFATASEALGDALPAAIGVVRAAVMPWVLAEASGPGPGPGPG